MAKEIWNEGRVVGYSAYELYVKQHLAVEGPDGLPPASEAQWLASSLAMGSSLLLKIPASPSGTTENQHYSIDIPLPKDSRLGAANTIVASFFDGEGNFPSTNVTGVNEGLQSNFWADKITDYGSLILNNSNSSPNSDGTNIPQSTPQDPSTWSDNLKAKLVNYMKIIDGIVIQPGEWYEVGSDRVASTSQKPPEKDEIQNLALKPTIRLHIKGNINGNFPRVLLTAFTIRNVLAGTSNTSTSTSPELKASGSTAPQDGDFLGPTAYPWANKIIFSVPNSYIAYFMSDKYMRRIPANTQTKSIKDTAVIDMNRGYNDPTYPDNDTADKGTAIDPHWFYSQTRQARLLKLPDYTNCEVPYTVDDFSTLGDGTSVLTVYEKKSIFPPALYGTFVNAKGTDYLSPLDCVAPGSVKMFIDDNGNVMNDYENTFPGTVSMNKDSTTGEISTIININGVPTKVPVASLGIGNFGNSKFVKIKVGNKTVKALSVSNDIGTNNQEPTSYLTDGGGGTLTPKGKFNWNDLTQALSQNKFIDILKTGLKAGNYINITNNSDGSYTINNTAPLTKSSLTDMLQTILKAGDGISITKNGNTFTITNTKPNNISGISYHYIKANKTSGGKKVFSVVMGSNFCGAKESWDVKGYSASSGGTGVHYIGFVDDTTYVNKVVRIGVNCGSLVQNQNTGLYDGVIYFKIDFDGTISGTGVHLANKNMNGTDDRASFFAFSHSNISNTTRAKKASIIRIEFQDSIKVNGKSIWGDLSTRTPYWNTYKESLWNVREVYNTGKSGTAKYAYWNPGGSFFPALNMMGPDNKNNPWGTVKGGSNYHYYTLYASAYYDGYNTQLSHWATKGGHIFGPWLNMRVEWACNVKGVNKDAILALAD